MGVDLSVALRSSLSLMPFSSSFLPASIVILDALCLSCAANLTISCQPGASQHATAGTTTRAPRFVDQRRSLSK